MLFSINMSYFVGICRTLSDNYCKSLQVMATIKATIDTRFKKLGDTYPIKLVVSHKGTSYITLGIDVKKDQWDGLKVIDHQKSKGYNEIIENRLILAKSVVIEAMMIGKLAGMENKDLKQAIELGSGSIPKEKKVIKHTVADHFNRYIANCRAKGTADMYQVTLGKLNQFDPGVTFDQINLIWLKSFETFLSEKSSVNTRGIHMRNLRAVFNDAINEDLIPLNAYPFRKFKIRKEKTIKRYMNIEQVKQFRDYPVQEHQRKYQELWMLVFYLVGINTVDLVHLKEKDLQNGRIEYIRAKTGREYSIEVLPEASEIIEKYKGIDYLLDVMDNYTNYKDFSSRWNSNLKEIGELEWVKNGAKDTKFVKKNKKKLTPLFPDIVIYTARRSWATIAGLLNIEKETIAAALGHGGNTVTDGYIYFDRKKIDQANRDVLAAIQ